MLKKTYKSYLKTKQQLEFFKHFMSKAIALFDRVYINIKELLSITFRNNRYFLLIKNNAFNMFFIYVIKTKDKIFSRL